ncbi:MAG: hypothetical protein HC923_03865 [Myxococcales bacterium]|nr:hypothetical protein [Myxococcales bacterium]
MKNFDEVGRSFLWCVQRELLAEPDDGELRELLDEVLAGEGSLTAGGPPTSARRRLRPSSSISR